MIFFLPEAKQAQNEYIKKKQNIIACLKIKRLGFGIPKMSRKLRDETQVESKAQRKNSKFSIKTFFQLLVNS